MSSGSIYLLLFAIFCLYDYCRAALFYPTNSAYGIFAAIAVPLDLPHRNVFISYNFEANYNLPYKWNVPPFAAGVENEDLFDEARHNADVDGDCTNCTATTTTTTTTEKTNTTTTESESENGTKRNNTDSEQHRERRSLLTRRHFYHILMDKFQRSGFQSESCLLRLICETNASGLAEINGVLGTLIHIIFSPSTSMNEDLPLKYYQAEIDGTHNHCDIYENDCKDNILDLISKPVHDIVNTFMNKYNYNNNNNNNNEV